MRVQAEGATEQDKAREAGRLGGRRESLSRGSNLGGQERAGGVEGASAEGGREAPRGRPTLSPRQEAEGWQDPGCLCRACCCSQRTEGVRRPGEALGGP